MVLNIFNFEKCVKFANEMTYTKPNQVHKYVYCYFGQFATKTIVNWQAYSSTCNTRTVVKIMFPW